MAECEIPFATASFLKSASQPSNDPVLRQLACASAALGAPKSMAVKAAAAAPIMRIALPPFHFDVADSLRGVSALLAGATPTRLFSRPSATAAAALQLRRSFDRAHRRRIFDNIMTPRERN